MRFLLLFVTLLLVVAPSAAAGTANSASRMIVWSKCDDLPSLTDAELDAWQARGAGGFVCMTGHLSGLGGRDVSALERRLGDSRVVERMRERGMKAYLGVYLTNYWNPRTPLAEWFDDSGWQNDVLPAMGELAGTARRLGFAGLAFDAELYATDGGRETATWNWDYAGNRRSEREVRRQAEARGRELMATLVDGFPGLELLAYDVEFPRNWSELVQREANGTPAANGDRLDVDFWNGLTQVEGYGPIRLIDGTFQKIPHYGNWDTALAYNASSIFAYLSRHLDNWDYASARFNVTPFAWIDNGPCACGFEAARSPQHVAAQLEAFRKWGMGGEFATYANRGLRGFDYGRYADAMRAASRPGVVDAERPSLTVERRGATVSGEVSDNLAVKVVRWRTDGGRSGVAVLDWRVTGGTATKGFSWRTAYSVRVKPRPGETRVVVSVEDIKGLVTRRSVALDAD